MNEQTSFKLWVIKFFLRVIYPKFNLNTFLVFLAIKYRIYYRKFSMAENNEKSTFEIRSISPQIQNFLAKEQVVKNLDTLLNKCLIISKDIYIQLAAENLFYMDNGILWLSVKLTPDIKLKYNNTKIKDKSSKYSLNFMTTKIHKKLWTDETNISVDNVRIVPVIGSKYVKSNIALTSESEIYNFILSFGLSDCDNIKITFHTLPAFEYAPKIASMAEVNLIVNDYDLSNEFIKEILSNHFETPKLLSTNDLFSVDLNPTVTTKYHYKYLDLVEAVGKLYFKCSKLVSNTPDTKSLHINNDKIQQAYFMVRGVTQLSLGENIHAVKPKDEYFKSPQLDNLGLLSLCPAGLKEKFDEIQDTIKPFIMGVINSLSTSMSNPIVPMLLLTGPVGSGKHLLIKCLAKFNGLNCLQVDCNVIQSSTAKQTESKINSTVQKAKAAAPVIVLLDNFEVFAVDPENNEDCRIMEYFTNTLTDLYQNYTKHPIIFIAVSEKNDLKPNIIRIFLEKFHIPRLNAKQRYDMLYWLTSAMDLNIDGNSKQPSELTEWNPISIQNNLNLSKNARDVLQRLAAKTETFLHGDIDTLVHFAMRESYLKQLKSINLPPDPNLHLVCEEDFEIALESIRRLQSQHLDAPKIPKVYWEDIGGLEKLKKELLKTIEFPIKYSHLFKNSSLKRSGILLYGPPGCGKTLVAKAVSTELNVSFLSVKGPELLNMYIGQSEENVRKVFESARASSPCIVFLDELDALAPRRGAAGDSGGASDRVVSQLLAEVDGVTGGEDADTQSFVFIMGATNRPDLLEQSLLRPGRLDKLIYVGPYSGVEEKSCVLKALCRSYKVRQEVNLEQVAAALPDRCTGADLLQVVTTARSAAVRGLVAKLHAGTVKESELSTDSVILGVSELWQGVESFRPSVTDEELAYYESLQAQM